MNDILDVGKMLEIEDFTYGLDASLEKLKAIMWDVTHFFEYRPEKDVDKILLDYERNRIKANVIMDYLNIACENIESLQESVNILLKDTENNQKLN